MKLLNQIIIFSVLLLLIYWFVTIALINAKNKQSKAELVDKLTEPFVNSEDEIGIDGNDLVGVPISYKNKLGLKKLLQYPVQFYDKIQTHDFLMRDEDSFVANMSSTSLESRTSTSRQGYKHGAANTAVSFVEKEKKVLEKMARKVDIFLYSRDPSSAQKLPNWIFAMTSGPYYENGQAHVRGKRKNVYFLPEQMLSEQLDSTCSLAQTLLYLRMETMYPSNPNPNVQYIAFTPPIQVPRSKFPPEWTMPSCNNIH